MAGKYLKIFWMLSKYSIATATQSKVSTLLFTIAKIIRFGMFFFFIYYLVAHTKTIKGYSVDQALIFFITFSIIDSTSQALFREVYRFRQMVVSGELNTVLVKPYPVLLRVLVGGVDPMDIAISVGYVLMAIYLIHASGGASVLSITMYAFFIFNSMVLATAFHVAVLALGIRTTDIDHSILIYRDLTAAGRFPLEIYKEPFRSILTFVVPIGIMMSFPSQALFGTLGLLAGIVGVVLAFGSLWLSIRFWNSALRSYQSWGG
jgi:ABC-2 type transport system permease protein